MAFTKIYPNPLDTEEGIARRVHAVSLSRNLDELASVIALMTIRQESNFRCPANKKDPTSFNYPHDSESDDGRSVGYLQQQNGVAGETAPAGQDWWGPMSCRMNLECSVNTFLERLPDDYTSATNGASAGQFAQRVQRSAYPDAYAKHWDYCWALLKKALATGVQNPPVDPVVIVKPIPGVQPNPGFRGDPIWLPDVLKAFGLDVYTWTDAEGTPWDQRGHGDFGVIDFVVWHHTGSVNETDEGIGHHPSLGLAANILIHPDGKVALIGSGIAWHAGDGIWPGVARGEMNQRSIGIECAYGPAADGQFTVRWPDPQIIAMVAVGAAISWFLGATLPVNHQIAHKEWAGRDNPLGINAQGKPDPGNLDMGWFRGEISKRLAEGPTGVAAIGGTPRPSPDPQPQPKPQPPVDPFLAWLETATEIDLLKYIAGQLGPGHPDWGSKGSTLRDFVWQHLKADEPAPADEGTP